MQIFLSFIVIASQSHHEKNTISLIKIEYSFIKKNHENNLFYHKTKKKEHLKVNSFNKYWKLHKNI